MMITVKGTRYSDFTFEVKAKRFDNDYNMEDTIAFLNHIAYELSCAMDNHKEHGYNATAEAEYHEMEIIDDALAELETEQELLKRWETLLA